MESYVFNDIQFTSLQSGRNAVSVTVMCVCVCMGVLVFACVCLHNLCACVLTYSGFKLILAGSRNTQTHKCCLGSRCQCRSKLVVLWDLKGEQ